MPFQHPLHPLPFSLIPPSSISFSSISSITKGIQDTYTAKGDLGGLIVTGLTGAGLDLLQQYLDRTDDLQTVALLAARNVIDDQAAVKAGLVNPSTSIIPSSSGGGGGGGVTSTPSTTTDPPSHSTLNLTSKGGVTTTTSTLPQNATATPSGSSTTTTSSGTGTGIGGSTSGNGGGRVMNPVDKREWRWLWEYRNLLNKMQVFLGRAALDVELGKTSINPLTCDFYDPLYTSFNALYDT